LSLSTQHSTPALPRHKPAISRIFTLRNTREECGEGASLRTVARDTLPGYSGARFPSFPHNVAVMQSRFEIKKRKILEQLDIPDEDYEDLSPKGSIDEPIRTLISDINRFDGLVTTSSCSGRISVFLEGLKKDIDGIEPHPEPQLGTETSRAGPGGKGGGGAWLFVSHSPVEVSKETQPLHFMPIFGLTESRDEGKPTPGIKSRYIHLKFEPMVRKSNANTRES
jgi:tRNA(Phe) wybutosine-synthesizing methylase Tyw3